jgi:predicted AAA+ superfamily ATPase
MSKTYLKRVVDQKLSIYLQTFGAVLIEGPKWCGKTTTASIHAKSILKMQEPVQLRNNLRIADSAPQLLLKGESPRLIDEWQIAPVLWNAIRSHIDEEPTSGQFILTGSTTPPNDPNMHTGTGRFGRLLMRPMSLFESLESTGDISLKLLFEGIPLSTCKSNLNIEQIAHLICRGGWPQSINKSEDSALLMAREYVKAIANEEINTPNGVVRDSVRVRSFLRAYARNIQTLSKNTTLLEDMKANDVSIDAATLYAYMNALQKIFVIEETPAWSPNIRSRTAIRTSNKKGFVDPSIAAAILGQTKSSLLNDFELFGFLFESLCIRDLRIYIDYLDGTISHYRDDYGLECDAVIHLNNGDFALVEIKLGGKEEDVAAKKLIELESLLLSKGYSLPQFKMILTGGELGYIRKDGVMVVPLGCLKP